MNKMLESLPYANSKTTQCFCTILFKCLITNMYLFNSCGTLSTIKQQFYMQQIKTATCQLLSTAFILQSVNLQLTKQTINNRRITTVDEVSSRRCLRGPIAANAVMLASRCRISSISANCSCTQTHQHCKSCIHYSLMLTMLLLLSIQVKMLITSKTACFYHRIAIQQLLQCTVSGTTVNFTSGRGNRPSTG